jgi:ATP-dependent RNA helicase DeaD
MTQKRNIEIGKVDIMKKFSFFEVDDAYEGEILKAFKNAKYEGGSISVELSKPDTKTATKREKSDYDYRKKKNRKRPEGEKRIRRKKRY